MEAESVLRSAYQRVVLFDFSGVTGVSHGFADELLTPLNELESEDLARRVVFWNCGARVREALELVAELHHLKLPRFEEARSGPALTH
jgi:hypothetical protein